MIAVRRISLVLLLNVFCGTFLFSQLIYFTDENARLHTVDISNDDCEVTTLGTMVLPGGQYFVPSDITFHPNGKLYGTDGLSLFEINVNTLDVEYIGSHNISFFNYLNSLVCDSDGVMYAANFSLFTINIINGEATMIGELPYQTAGDLAFNNGKLYAACIDNVMMEVNIVDPPSSSAVGVINSNSLFFGIVTFATNCEDIETFGTSDGSLYQLSVDDAGSTFYCELLSNQAIFGAAMETDFIASDCEFFVDLDYDDSSGALEYDYIDTICGNAPAPIADFDVDVIAETTIDSMLIWITSGIMDGADEQLLLPFAGNMQVFGSGTSSLKLVSTGPVSELDLENALANTQYINNDINYTPGERQISVKFYAPLGDESNVATAFIYLAEPVPFSIDLGPDTSMCDGEILVLDPLHPQAESYLWQDGSTAAVYEATASGTYSVTVTDICNNTATASLNAIFTPPSSTINLGPDTTICSGDDFILDATILEATNYLWQNGSDAPVFVVNEGGSYAVSVTLDCGIITDEITINYEEIIDVSLFNEDTLICDGEPLVLGVDFPNALAYEWQNGETTPEVTITSAGTYSLNVYFQCGELYDAIEVNYIDYVLAFDLGPDLTYCYGDSVMLSANAPLGTNYRWQDDSEESDFVAYEPGVYSVTVSDACQEATDEIVLKAESCCNLYVPNVFTPNFDGTNDTLKSFSDCEFPVFSFRIFNRWGGLVFQSDKQGEGWDGIINDEKANQGVYVWIIEYNDGLQDYMESGDLTLMR